MDSYDPTYEEMIRLIDLEERYTREIFNSLETSAINVKDMQRMRRRDVAHHHAWDGPYSMCCVSRFTSFSSSSMIPKP